MKKIIIGIIVIAVVGSGAFLFHSSSTKKSISALGYSDKQVDKFIEEYGIFSAADKAKKDLDKEIKGKEKVVTDEIGVSTDLIENKNKLTRVEYNDALDVFIEETISSYTTSISEVDTQLAKYPTEEEVSTENLTLHEELTLKEELLVQIETSYSTQIEEHKTALLDYGMRESELDSLLTGDLVSDLEALTNKIEYYEEYQALVSTSGNSYAGGAMDLFNILNNHRVSQGLAPFTYNSAEQGCVDIEANSYANNKNPHNWLCKTLTSEGASLASVNSDYIQIAGNFLTTHASHEADVVNPNYTSAACSAVQRDGMVYMICGYFQ